MPPITDAQVEAVRALIVAIPPGRVATYGDLAAATGLTSARQVGWILRTDGADLPWHRVIRASGLPARHLGDEQLARLRAEGVLARDGRVDLAVYRWQPTGQTR
ncbi:DNA methyltransferase [Mycolicibacillus koreensis]|nr:DNA methyltransferase [Mycolicibacillus koreensis]